MTHNIEATLPKGVIESRKMRRKALSAIGAIGLAGLAFSNEGVRDSASSSLEQGISHAVLAHDVNKCQRYGDGGMPQYAADVWNVAVGRNPEYFNSIAQVEEATQMPFYTTSPACGEVGNSYWALIDSKNQ